MISEKEKAIILGYAVNGPGSPDRQAHVHEESPSEEIFHDAEQPTTETPDAAPTMQANQSQQQSAPKYPPHDIRAILSQKNKAPSHQANMSSIVYKVSASRT
eukprot:scaffold37234_cov382-Amphora_coffeaeformis.AAC.1